MIRFAHNPVDSPRITSPFGYRTHPILKERVKHNGTDFGATNPGRSGDTIYAVADGKVLISKVNEGGPKVGYGYYIVIQHEGFASLSGHMESLSELKPGDKVKAGQRIGKMGNTGTSTSPHLHFAITIGNYSSKQWVDPAHYIIKEDIEVVQKIKIEINGVIREVEAINKEGNNFVKLRDLTDALKVDYDPKRNLPIVKSKAGA